MAVYLGRRHDKSILYYSVLLISLSSVLGVKGIIQQTTLTIEHTIPLYFIAQFFAGSALFLFSNSILGTKRFEKTIKQFIAVSFIGSLLAVIYYYIFHNYRVPSIALIAICVTWALIIATRMTIHFLTSPQKLYKDKWRMLVFYGIIIYASSYFISMFLTLIGVRGGNIEAAVINVGALLLSSFSAFALAMQFNNEHHELQKTKENLEERIKERTSELVEANRRIEQEADQKTAMFINLAHETKTPLTLIKYNLEKYLKDTEEDERLSAIKQNIEHLLADMVNFLDSEKIMLGKILYEHNQIINLSTLVEKKATVFEAVAKQRGISISTSIDKEMYVKADFGAIDRVINNLLDNAFKYNKENGSITISIYSSGSEGVLTIADTGEGISQEHLKHIFEPYFQVSHKKRNIQGLGMGLHITKAIVESLHGNVDVQSEFGKGTKFALSIPLHKLSDGEKVEEISVAKPLIIVNKEVVIDSMNETARHTIMLVEDNTSLLCSIRDELAAEYNVICAQNGLQAIDKIKDCVIPDLIVSDIMMDGMDGHELRENLSKNEAYKHIPFIFLTAKTTRAESLQGLAAGAIDYIHKPFSIDILRAKIAALIENAVLRRKLFEGEKFRTIGKLVGSISHEIMNPIAGMEGPVFVLEEALNTKQIEDKESINESLNHLKSCMKRVSDSVSTLRVLFQGGTYEIRKISVKSHLEAAIRVFSQKVQERIKIEHSIPDDFEVSANGNILHQVFMNIISNSVDAISGNGEIRISSSYDDGKKTIVIADSGIGIEKKDIERIFELGYTSKKSGEGSGIGLYIVRQLLEKLRAEIVIESEVQKGTTVRISFPQ